MNLGIRTALAVAGALSAMTAPAAPRDAFAYTMRMTPEEGPVDPAIQRHYTAQWKTCQDHARAAPENVACFQAEFKRQDSRLNQAWTRAMRRVPGPRHRALLLAQRHWIAMRDPFCTDFTKELRGSLTSIAFLDCQVEQTIRRTIWLEGL